MKSSLKFNLICGYELVLNYGINFEENNLVCDARVTHLRVYNILNGYSLDICYKNNFLLTNEYLETRF